jgi:hypothetical protein
MIFGVLLAVAMMGCANREHIRDDFGERTRMFLAKQRVYPTAAVDSPGGLDSEEASLIHGAYRKSMGGASSKPVQKSERVLVLEQPQKGN